MSLLNTEEKKKKKKMFYRISYRFLPDVYNEIVTKSKKIYFHIAKTYLFTGFCIDLLNYNLKNYQKDQN